MKYIFILLVGLLVIVSLSSFLNLLFGDNRSPKSKIAHHISNEVGKKFKSNYGLDFSGLGEAAPDGKYTSIDFSLSYPKILTKDQGRALLVSCMQEAVQTFNLYPQFKPYMANYPFTDKNITITIIIKPKNGSEVLYPDILVFAFYLNKLRYKTNSVDTLWKGEYYTEERETYEEALKILADQQKGYN